jgi:hypothetical protein
LLNAAFSTAVLELPFYPKTTLAIKKSMVVSVLITHSIKGRYFPRSHKSVCAELKQRGFCIFKMENSVRRLIAQLYDIKGIHTQYCIYKTVCSWKVTYYTLRISSFIFYLFKYIVTWLLACLIELCVTEKNKWKGCEVKHLAVRTTVNLEVPEDG